MTLLQFILIIIAFIIADFIFLFLCVCFFPDILLKELHGLKEDINSFVAELEDTGET